MRKNSRIYSMLAATLALLLASLDQTIVATALPEIVRELNGLSHLSWVVSAYLLTSTVAAPIIGKLSDSYGRKIIFILAIALFLFGSILSGISWSMLSLILFRAIQGIGGGAIMVNCYAIIGDLFAPAERGRWQGFISGAYGLASIIGPLLGGWLTDFVSWRWIFYINIPIGLIALSVIWWKLPYQAPNKEKKAIDFAGAVFLILFITPILLALVWGGNQEPWLSPVIFGLFLVSGICLPIFLLIEKYASDPILPLWLFKHSAFTIPIAIMFLMMTALFGSALFIPLFAQAVFGLNATHAGLLLTPMMLALVTTSVLSGQLISHVYKYKLLAVIGVALVTIAMFLFSYFTINTTLLELYSRLMLMGFGLGMIMPILNLVIQTAFGFHYLGVVTSTVQVARSIGGAVCAALLGGLFNSALALNIKDISHEPFSKYFPRSEKEGLSSIENFLTPEGYATFKKVITHLPKEKQPSEEALLKFLSSMRLAFSEALSTAYFIAACILVLAFLLVLFLPVIPLRK